MKAKVKKQNPDGQLKPRGITLPEVKKWMLTQIKKYDDYDPRDLAKYAIIQLNIINLTPEEKKIIIDLAYKTADEYEMNKGSIRNPKLINKQEIQKWITVFIINHRALSGTPSDINLVTDKAIKNLNLKDYSRSEIKDLVFKVFQTI